METPSGLHQVLVRKWTYAPPDWRMYDAVVSERDHWLKLLTGELMPEVAESTRPSRVVLRPWVDPKVRQAEVLIEPDGYGARLVILLQGDDPDVAQGDRTWLRYRLGTLFGAALRSWVDDGCAQC